MGDLVGRDRRAQVGGEAGAREGGLDGLREEPEATAMGTFAAASSSTNARISGYARVRVRARSR